MSVLCLTSSGRARLVGPAVGGHNHQHQEVTLEEPHHETDRTDQYGQSIFLLRNTRLVHKAMKEQYEELFSALPLSKGLFLPPRGCCS